MLLTQNSSTNSSAACLCFGCHLKLKSTPRCAAEWLTGYENHRTEAAHRTSLIIKRVCFEAFDCYIALFYLAFWQRDILQASPLPLVGA